MIDYGYQNHARRNLYHFNGVRGKYWADIDGINFMQTVYPSISNTSQHISSGQAGKHKRWVIHTLLSVKLRKMQLLQRPCYERKSSSHQYLCFLFFYRSTTLPFRNSLLQEKLYCAIAMLLNDNNNDLLEFYSSQSLLIHTTQFILLTFQYLFTHGFMQNIGTTAETSLTKMGIIIWK